MLLLPKACTTIASSVKEKEQAVEDSPRKGTDFLLVVVTTEEKRAAIFFCLLLTSSKTTNRNTRRGSSNFFTVLGRVELLVATEGNRGVAVTGERAEGEGAEVVLEEIAAI